MWIRLTSTDGRPVSFNTKHLVALRDHGPLTMVIHSRGEVLVQESQLAILSALRRHGGAHSERNGDGLPSLQ